MRKELFLHVTCFLCRNLQLRSQKSTESSARLYSCVVSPVRRVRWAHRTPVLKDPDQRVLYPRDQDQARAAAAAEKGEYNEVFLRIDDSWFCAIVLPAFSGSLHGFGFWLRGFWETSAAEEEQAQNIVFHLRLVADVGKWLRAFFLVLKCQNVRWNESCEGLLYFGTVSITIFSIISPARFCSHRAHNKTNLETLITPDYRQGETICREIRAVI